MCVCVSLNIKPKKPTAKQTRGLWLVGFELSWGSFSRMQA